MKTCTRCKQSKPLTEYSYDGKVPKGRCKACTRDIYRLRYGDNLMVAKQCAENRAFNALMKTWRIPSF